MGSKNTLLIAVLFPFLMFRILTGPTVAEEEVVSSVVVEFQHGELVINARGAALGMVLEEIKGTSGVEILGLESREDELITYSSQGVAPEKEVKRFLNYLGEKNYAFEFADGKLKRALVLPEAEKESSSISSPTEEEAIQKDFVTAPQVQRIVEGSQAEFSNILIGDVIVEYGGIRIYTAQQLVEETKKREDYEQVEMMVIRNGQPVRIVMNGGFIGVVIKTARVPKDELDEYYSPRQ